MYTKIDSNRFSYFLETSALVRSLKALASLDLVPFLRVIQVIMPINCR